MASRTLTIVNPTGETAEETFKTEKVLEEVKGASIALIDSTRPNSSLLIAALKKALIEAGAGSVAVHRGFAPGLAVPKEALRRMVEGADGVIFGAFDGERAAGYVSMWRTIRAYPNYVLGAEPPMSGRRPALSPWTLSGASWTTTAIRSMTPSTGWRRNGALRTAAPGPALSGCSRPSSA